MGHRAADDPATSQGLDPALEALSAQVMAAAPAETTASAAPATEVVTVVVIIPAGGTAEAGRTLAQVETP